MGAKPRMTDGGWKLRCMGLLALAAAQLAPPPAQAKPRAPRVAVFELELRNVRLKASMARILRDYLSDRLAATGAYRVVPGDKTRSALNREQLRSQSNCFAKSCQIRIGRALAADRSLSTRVMGIGRTCTVTATLFNLEEQVTEKGASAKGGCGEEALQGAIDIVVRKLTGGGGADGAEPPPPPPGPGSGGGIDQDLPPEKAEVGTLVVEGTPKGARIDVKGPPGFRGPAAAGLPHTWRGVPAGSYTVLVRSSKYEEHRMTAEVLTDRTRVVPVKLLLAYGSLYVGGEPAGARVEVTGRGGFSKRWGLTGGFTLQGVPRGQVKVRVSRKGYESLERELEVSGGQVSRVEVKLKAVQSLSGNPGQGAGASTAGLQWVGIPGGSFRMGSTEGADDEKPVHSVQVASFSLLKSEVTMGQYRGCVAAGACSEPEKSGDCNWGKGTNRWYDSLPINCVDWNQARKFCAWAGGRLPSESEWEYAARSGGKAWKYPWGNEEATCSRTVMNEEGWGCGKKRTWPVCSKASGNSAHGVCDLAGNVWEWVEDCWHSSYEGAPSSAKAWTSNCSDSGRVGRGGSGGDDAGYLRAAYRFRFSPGPRNDILGFRCAR